MLHLSFLIIVLSDPCYSLNPVYRTVHRRTNSEHHPRNPTQRPQLWRQRGQQTFSDRRECVHRMVLPRISRQTVGSSQQVEVSQGRTELYRSPRYFAILRINRAGYHKEKY